MIALVASLLLLSRATPVNATPSLSMTLSGPTEVSHIDSLLVHAIITNTGDEPLKLYKDPRSSLHPFPTDTFSFTCIDDDEYNCPQDDEASGPGFIGAKAKYTFETANDFVNLAVGESVNVTHQISSAYNFTQPGTYAINATNTFHYVDPVTHKPQIIHGFFTNTHASRVTGDLVSLLIERHHPVERDLSVTAGVDVDAVPAELDVDAGLPGVDLKANVNQGPKFEGCTATEKDQISTALGSTIEYLDNSVSYLETFPAPSASLRYKEWFGEYDSGRMSTVLTHFKNIQRTNPKTYTYNCNKCQINAFAYVFPDAPFKVYLCQAFWTAPSDGSDSKAGTIVHESSHFLVNAGTKDLAYGEPAAVNLATSDPPHAIMNADSHEYFAENTPPLV